MPEQRDEREGVVQSQRNTTVHLLQSAAESDVHTFVLLRQDVLYCPYIERLFQGILCTPCFTHPTGIKSSKLFSTPNNHTSVITDCFYRCMSNIVPGPNNKQVVEAIGSGTFPFF